METLLNVATWFVVLVVLFIVGYFIGATLHSGFVNRPHIKKLTKAEQIEFYLSWRNTAIMVLVRNPEDKAASEVKSICEKELVRLGVL